MAAQHAGRRRLSVFLAVALLPWAAAAATEDSQNETTSAPYARLVLARKSIAREAIVVEGKPLSMRYQVYNLGDVPALEVSVADEIDRQWFELVDGESSARIAQLAPGESHGYNITVVPRKSGVVVVDRAIVRYSVNGMAKRSISSSPGRLKVTSAGEYLRATSYYLWEWFIFALFTSIPTALPAYYYFTHK